MAYAKCLQKSEYTEYGKNHYLYHASNYLTNTKRVLDVQTRAYRP